MVAAEGLLEGGLYETFEREVLRKASEFVFAHLFLFAFCWLMPMASTPRTGIAGVKTIL